MANGTFFVSWELWQQMTFVLAMSIAFVFLIGLMKLWWTNRHMKKIEELDAEKQVRAAQMRRSGLPAHRRSSRLETEIPFGVKALESGVEVDGVWVARMASMASRPPNRKWTSKRKIKTPVMDVDASSSNRSGRRSVRAGRISRREIVKPSTQMAKKLESLPLPEGGLQSNGSGANQRQPLGGMEHEEPRSPTQEDRGGRFGHTGPLGRIQRSLKKMTSSESWNEHPKKQLGGQEAIEFRLNAQARKPQRFYPQAATPLAPIRGMPSHQSIPQRRSSLHSISDRSSTEAARSGPAAGGSSTQPMSPLTTAPRNNETRQHISRASSTSSAESFVTNIEELKEFSPRSRPPPLEHHPAFSSSDLTQAPGEMTFGRRRSRRSSPQNGHARHSSSEDRSTIHEQQQQQHDAASQQSAPATALRYPPNSSRSAAYIQQPRPQSFTSDQQQRPIGAASSSAAQPSPTFGPSDSYINTTTRKVNSNFEVLPAGTFGLPEQHAPEEPVSTAASVRSSFESQRSGRKKLQKKRASSSYSK